MTEYKTIRIKYAGKCSSCGGTIERGALALWNSATRSIAHNSDSVACAARLKKNPDAGLASSFDRAYEDQCADACGLGGFGPRD